jgi:CubicO group peptidase (beta-lactamase class C family)
MKNEGKKMNKKNDKYRRLAKVRGLSSILYVLLVVALLAALLFVAARPNDTGNVYSEAIKLARTGIWKNINSGKSSSASVAILDNGKVVYSEGFGMADREQSTPVDTKTIFNMGSVSKVFCTAAVMRLVDDGKVELDAPLTNYLPDFKMADPRYKDITVRMLLNHTSGVPGTAYANNMGYAFNNTAYEETLANLAHSNLKAAPGETAPYCNDGFTLAEILVAKVSGQKYIDFLSERVLKPLSLDRTGLSVGERTDEGIGLFYQPDTAKKVPPEVLSIVGAGGLSSNAENLVVFMDSFSDGGQKVLSDKSTAEIIKAQPSSFAKASVKETGINPEMAYGLGFDFVESPPYMEKGIKLIGKGGASDSFKTIVLSAPTKRISVAILSAGVGDVESIALDILNSVLEAKGILKTTETPVKAPPSPQAIPPEYAALAGYYAGETLLFKISFDFNQNIVTMATMVGGQQVHSRVLTYRNGYLYDENGFKYIILSVGGRSYMIVSIHDAYVILAEKVPVASEPKTLRMDINGMKWLRRNVKPFEVMSLTATHFITSAAQTDLPGYIDFYGLKRIDSPDFAGMVSDGIRDETELTLLDRSGQTWVRVSEMLYSPIDTAMPLGTGDKTVIIGKEGYNEWFKTGQDLVLNVTKPSGARVIVFSPGASVVYDSAIDKGKVFVAAGSLIELAGMPGDVLEVVAEPSPR